MPLETFGDVIQTIKKNQRRKFHLLLGNGFSVSYDPDIFSYNALHDFVTKLHDEDLSTILGVLETRNFELIMQQLDSLSLLLQAFGGEPLVKKRIDGASAKLRRGLLDAVKALHPEHVFTIPQSEVEACGKFLKTFLDTGGGIFSTNYDLLLYWVLMRSNTVAHIDGCGRELDNPDDVETGEEPDWSDLTWGKYRDRQNTFYLHGALQFFDAGVSITKEQYDNYSYLLQKISDRMEAGEYPIFVTAGDGRQKLTHIMHNHYLSYCYERFAEIDGSLVTFGFNFGSSDEHIIDAVNRAARQKLPKKLWSLYVGVYSEQDRQHVEEIKSKFRCKVHLYDAKTANVWR